MTATPGWYPDPGGSGGQRYFDGSRWTEDRTPAKKPSAWVSIPATGWIVLAAVALVVVAGIVVVAVVSNTRDSESYRYGYEEVGPLAMVLLNSGIDGTEYACEQATGMVAWTDRKLVEEDVIAGCVDASNG